MTVEPDFLEAEARPINNRFFHIQYFNSGKGAFRKVKRTFAVKDHNIETVVVFKENGREELQVPICQWQGSSTNIEEENKLLRLKNAEWDLSPKTKFLHISGDVMTYSGDDTIVLKKAVSQGINPTILLMDVIWNHCLAPTLPVLFSIAHYHLSFHYVQNF